MKKMAKSILSIVLIISTLLCATVPALAAGTEEYICELRLVYAEDYEEAKQILAGGEFSDYKLLKENLNKDSDEIGVFLAKSDEDVAELRRVCEEYVRTLQKEQRAFVASYAPREATKLDAATVRVFGRYVVYAVLDEEACEEAFSCVKEMLEE